MKTTKELDKLKDAIEKANSTYYSAIESNIKEYGKEVPILFDDEDEEGLRLSVRGNDNDLNYQVVDKVRWNKDNNCVEYHCAEFDYQKTDNWIPIHWLSEEIDYVYDNIDWEGITD